MPMLIIDPSALGCFFWHACPVCVSASLQGRCSFCTVVLLEPFQHVDEILPRIHVSEPQLAERLYSMLHEKHLYVPLAILRCSFA
jgi:hypothetical protein